MTVELLRYKLFQLGNEGDTEEAKRFWGTLYRVDSATGKKKCRACNDSVLHGTKTGSRAKTGYATHWWDVHMRAHASDCTDRSVNCRTYLVKNEIFDQREAEHVREVMESMAGGLHAVDVQVQQTVQAPYQTHFIGVPKDGILDPAVLEVKHFGAIEALDTDWVRCGLGLGEFGIGWWLRDHLYPNAVVGVSQPVFPLDAWTYNYGSSDFRLKREYYYYSSMQGWPLHPDRVKTQRQLLDEFFSDVIEGNVDRSRLPADQRTALSVRRLYNLEITAKHVVPTPGRYQVTWLVAYFNPTAHVGHLWLQDKDKQRPAELWGCSTLAADPSASFSPIGTPGVYWHALHQDDNPFNFPKHENHLYPSYPALPGGITYQVRTMHHSQQSEVLTEIVHPFDALAAHFSETGGPGGKGGWLFLKPPAPFVVRQHNVPIHITIRHESKGYFGGFRFGGVKLERI